MFIDIHVHAVRIPGPLRLGKPAFATPEQLIARYDNMGVEKAVLLPIVNSECTYVWQSNEDILEMAEKYPCFIPFCNIDPRAMTHTADAPLDELLQHYRALGCRGIGEVCANLPFLHPMVQNLFKHAQNLHMPLCFHMAHRQNWLYGLYDEPGLPQLEESLRKFPELIFLGHSQAFWAEISALETPGDRTLYPGSPVKQEGAVPKLMRRYPNLCGDLSAGSGYAALARDRQYAARFLQEFQERLFFGTDICAPDTPAPLAALLLEMRKNGDISDQTFDRVARQNAISLLGLEEERGEDRRD